MANTLRFKRGLVSGIPTAALGEPLFTTDTFDLYIGNGTGNTRFQKYIASGTTSQLLRGDGSLLTMPIVLTSPSNGQVLKFNGTNWVNDSDAGITGSGAAGYLPKFTGATTLGNSIIYDDGTTIGIGTTAVNSNEKLRIVGGRLNVIAASDAYQLKLSYNNATAGFWFGSPSANTLSFYNDAGTERGRFTSTGNLHLGTFVSDNGARLQVSGTSTFSDSVGIGATSLTSYSLRVGKTIVGALSSTGIYQDGTVQSTVTSNAFGIYNSARTQAAAFTLTNYYHFYTDQFTLGAGSAITNQYGYVADATLTGATNNFGFYGNIASGTGRWNLYMNGTAANYLNGNLGIGTTTINVSLLAKAITISSANSGLELTSATNVVQGTVQSNTNGLTLEGIGTSGMRFFTSASGTTTERMRLDASGNLGLGLTPSAWGATWRALELQYSSGGQAIAAYYPAIIANAYNTGGGFFYKETSQASYYQQIIGQHRWFNAPSGTAGAAVTFTQAMTLFATGNLALGSTSDGGQRLQVTGTSNFTGNMTVDTETFFVDAVNNKVGVGTITPADRFSVVTSGGKTTLGIGDNAVGTYSQVLMYGGSGKYNWTLGAQYNINNGFEITPSTALGGTTFSTPVFSILQTGAATFSSSVTAAYNVVTGGLAAFISSSGGLYSYYTGGVGVINSVSNNSGSASPLDLSSGGTRAIRIFTSANVGINTTSDLGYRLRVNGTSYFDDNLRFPNLKGVVFVQTGGSLLGSISMDSSNQVTIDNNGFFGLSVGSNYTMTGGNLGIGQGGAAFGSGTRVISVVNGTAPSSSVATSFLMYSANVTTGNAAPHFRTENGAVIKLYQETTSVGNAIISLGGGNAVLDDTTFDGYTLRQIVRALRNQGILA